MTQSHPLNSALVLVAGATGGVGQLAVGQLVMQGIPVRALTRNPEKAEQLFAGPTSDQQATPLQITQGDILNPATLPAAVEGVTHIICCTGTTAFPSQRWQFPEPKAPGNPLDWLEIYGSPQNYGEIARNSPQKVDAEGVENLVQAAPKDLQQFVLISSCGILRRQQLPFSILNAFGVLDAKLQGETTLIQSGLPYTIIRPGRLIDGPYTSYDLNTLIKAKTKGQYDVVLGQGDTLSGEASRIDVARAAVECLNAPITVGKTFDLINEGARPTAIDWSRLFSTLA
ncbi:MAG: SDR family oxidoreductase [Cyanobacteria bacterium P01_A01_bin.17]